MPQRQRDDVRQSIVAAAQRRLAQSGYRGMSLVSVAEEAGTSVGNLYRYFESKDELFSEAINAKRGQQLRSLLRRRVEALGDVQDVSALSGAHPYRVASRELLAFVVEHRWEVLFLLRHAAGTPYEGFAEVMATDLQRLAETYASRAYPGLVIARQDRRDLARIYRAFVASLASILNEERTAKAIAAAVDRYTAYHLSGLRALFTRRTH